MILKTLVEIIIALSSMCHLYLWGRSNQVQWQNKTKQKPIFFFKRELIFNFGSIRRVIIGFQSEVVIPSPIPQIRKPGTRKISTFSKLARTSDILVLRPGYLPVTWLLSSPFLCVCFIDQNVECSDVLASDRSGANLDSATSSYMRLDDLLNLCKSTSSFGKWGPYYLQHRVLKMD